MKIFLKALVWVSVIFVCYCSASVPPLLFASYALLYLLGLLYHLVIDKKRNKLFTSVFLLFLASSLCGVYLANNTLEGFATPIVYLSTVQLLWMLGFITIFLKMLKEHPVQKLRLNKGFILIIIITLVDIYFANVILDMGDKYNLSLAHILYSFAFTILKLVLLSIALVLVVLSSQRNLKNSFLMGVLICFFMSDIISTYNSIMFFENPLVALSILESGIYCVGLTLFYFYCVSPDIRSPLAEDHSVKALKKEETHYFKSLGYNRSM